MIILTNAINLYGKNVITDLATRTGNSTVNDYSYGLGLSYKVRDLWRNNDTDANLEMLFNDQDDFDADVVQPNLSDEEYDESLADEEKVEHTPYNPAVDKTSFDKYYRRLEDIANGYLEKYLGFIVYNVKNHADGIKAYNAKHKDQPLLISTDGDDFTEFADLQLRDNSNDYPVHVKQNAIQHLPYVIKRLHNMSCYTGVHMLSYIVAFIKAKERNNSMRIAGSVKTLKHNAVVDEGVYLCDKFGNIVKKTESNSRNNKATWAFDWILGVSKEYQTYYQDYLDFVYYCKVLNIDIYNDDMSKYQKSFVDRLIVTTVTPNKQYNKQVYNALLQNKASVLPELEEVDLDPVDNTIDVFTQICEVNDIMLNCIAHFDTIKAADNMQTVQSLYNTYSVLYNGATTDTSKYSWENGYLYYDGALAMLPAYFLSAPDPKGNSTSVCIIHELGYCIQVSDSMSLFVLDVYNAMENMMHRIQNNDPEYKYMHWMRLST